MGAPCMITAPSKSYVVINSIGSDKSIPPTQCDLGRVSSLATAVTLSRTSNIASRINITQNPQIIHQRTRRIHQRKRPISEVLDNSISKELKDNTLGASSVMNQPNSRVPHTNDSGSHDNQSSITVSANPFSQTKRNKVESTSSSPDMSSRNLSVSKSEKAPMNLSTQYQASRSANLPPQISSMRIDQVPYLGTEVDIESKNPVRTHSNQQPSQQPTPLLTSGMVNLQTQVSPSIAMQLHQQNQQLRSENMVLQKQLSLFRQLMKNPQRLNQILARLDQRAQ